jgi:dihydrofolate reductase
MGHVIVIEFSTLDGFVSDPDGSAGTPTGGWAFRHGPDTVAGDKFRLGAAMDTGVLLLGRRTWQLFAGLWPRRTDPFSARMNAMAKLVATRDGDLDVRAWANSAVLRGDLTAVVDAERAHRDVIVTGSISVVHALIERDLVDEYRLLTFPSAIGTGDRLFPAGGPPVHLEISSVQRTGAAVLTTLQRAAAPLSTASTSASANPSSGT